MSMTTQQLDIPVGAPCWMDLLTSDVDRAIEFYGNVFGWKGHDTGPEFSGYRYFEKDGKAVGGCMANSPDWGVTNGWSIYLKSNDVRATAEAAKAHGGEVLMEPMDVGPNGSFVVLRDAGGSAISAWQSGTEAGFGALREEGAPVHFELHTRNFDRVLQFYKNVFGWQPRTLDAPGFRYAAFGDEMNPRAGVMDATDFLPEGSAGQWSVYLAVENADKTLDAVRQNGGSIVTEAEDTPYGRLATAADPTGAVFKLRS